jgi:hypothetical protein
MKSIRDDNLNSNYLLSIKNKLLFYDLLIEIFSTNPSINKIVKSLMSYNRNTKNQSKWNILKVIRSI